MCVPITVQVTSKKLIVPHAMLSSLGLVRIRALLLGTIDFSEHLARTLGLLPSKESAMRGLSFIVSVERLRS